MMSFLAGWSRETVNTVSDVVGIVAVLAGLCLLLLLDSRNAAGRAVARSAKAGALVLLGFSVLVIGGRFEVLPSASTSSETTAGGTDEQSPATTTASTADGSTSTTEAEDGDSTSTPVGPPAPSDPVDEGADDEIDDESGDEPDASTDDEPAEPRGSPGSYTVEAGDSFWSIAESMLEESRDGPVTDAEVAPYWQSLVDVNVDGLVEAGNPDLILPGQVLQVPSVTASTPAT